jgi:hypothetical protein
MFRPLLRVLLGLALLASVSFAGTITSIHIELGNWDGTTFTRSGSDWNTYDPSNWAIGATAPGFGNPLLNSFQSVSLPDGHYYLYMAEAYIDRSPAIRIILGYDNAPSATGIFTSPGFAEYDGPYTLVSSTFAADLVTGPQTVNTAVGSGQTYSSTGEANWVLDLDTNAAIPEPGSLILFGTGIGALALIRRRAAR